MRVSVAASFPPHCRATVAALAVVSVTSVHLESTMASDVLRDIVKRNNLLQRAVFGFQNKRMIE